MQSSVVVMLFSLILAASSANERNPLMSNGKFTKWTHFTIEHALPGSAWGTGGTGLADLNGDGMLEYAVSRRETKTAYWFERKDDATWIRHTIGQADSLERTLGGAMLDIDQDGWIDIAFRGVWFKNPGNLAEHPDTPWEAFPYDGGGHDVIAADINGDGHLDLITYDGHELAWFNTSKGMAKTVIVDDRDDHGGVAPAGVGDLNGNGIPDIVLAGTWYENPGDGTGTWKRHAWPHQAVPKASYGTSMRSWVADINGSGWNDIVYSDCDTGFGHVYWVENIGKGEEWLLHRLPDPPGDSRTGSFHSLGVADFDQDGNLDIFAGEQEDPDTYMEGNGLLPMKPRGLKERGVIWVNSGGTAPSFEPVVIHEDHPGWHDAALGDVNGDGAIDIVTKIWNADGPTYHVDYWRNDINREDAE